jgi:hypothetical protein
MSDKVRDCTLEVVLYAGQINNNGEELINSGGLIMATDEKFKKYMAE